MKWILFFVFYLSIMKSSAYCPYDWLDFGDYGCFKFVDDSNLYPMSWTQGREYCQSLYPNSDLVQISSLITQSILSSIALYEYREQSWLIGATLVTHEYEDQDWVWIGTNETMYFTNWENEEPSNSNFGEYCLEMLGNGKWNDIDCNGFFGIYRRPICQLF